MNGKNDRELLELAAKALGNEFEWKHEPRMRERGVGRRWNPLEDDGDALRLAVKCRMKINEEFYGVIVQIPQKSIVCEEFGYEHESATRRAIVRAAAAIGEKA